MDLDAPVFTGQVHLEISYRSLILYSKFRKDWLIQDLIREGKMKTDDIEPFNERFKEARAKVAVKLHHNVQVGDVDLACSYEQFANLTENQKELLFDKLVKEGALKLTDIYLFNARFYESRSKLAGWWYWWIYDALSCSSMSTDGFPRRSAFPTKRYTGKYWNDVSTPPTPTHSPPATRPSSPTTTIAEREPGCITENVASSDSGGVTSIPIATSIITSPHEFDLTAQDSRET